jgi:hypothetical protein
MALKKQSTIVFSDCQLADGRNAAVDCPAFGTPGGQLTMEATPILSASGRAPGDGFYLTRLALFE